jgi:cytochrome d ubiquinol oxidase subunit II
MTTMTTGDLWFCLLAFMGIMYVILDGFDLGAGAVHLLVARSDAERRLVLRSIGPVWDGNEVWLIAAGGTLFFAFPALYAASFSGFYLPLMIVLWLLMLRGIAIEFRNHLDSPAWTPAWDVVFSASSLLLALFYGVALGNVVRGVPLTGEGWFFEPLWTDLRVAPEPGIFDWYTVSVGLTALAALVLHGALWLHCKTEGALQARARHIADRAWWSTFGLTVLITIFTWIVQPQLSVNAAAHPWGFVFPLAAATGLFGVRRQLARGAETSSFLASCAYLAGMLASAAFSVHPFVLPTIGDASNALTVDSAAAPRAGLEIALVWWLPGIVLAVVYALYVYRRFRGKVRLEAGWVPSA